MPSVVVGVAAASFNFVFKLFSIYNCKFTIRL